MASGWLGGRLDKVMLGVQMVGFVSWLVYFVCTRCCDKRYTHDKYFIRIDLTMSSGTGITQRYQFLKDIPKQPRLGNCRLHVLSPGLCECPSVHLSICIYGLPMICTRYRYRYVFTY